MAVGANIIPGSVSIAVYPAALAFPVKARVGNAGGGIGQIKDFWVMLSYKVTKSSYVTAYFFINGQIVGKVKLVSATPIGKAYMGAGVKNVLF